MEALANIFRILLDWDEDAAGRGARSPHLFLRVIALTATMTVDRLMRTAPTAGLSRMPTGARTPAASGMATML